MEGVSYIEKLTLSYKLLEEIFLFEDLVDTLTQEKVQDDLIKIKKEARKKYNYLVSFQMSIFDIEKLCPSLTITNKCVKVDGIRSEMPIGVLDKTSLNILFGKKPRNLTLNHKFDDVSQIYRSDDIKTKNRVFKHIHHRNKTEKIYIHPVILTYLSKEYTSNTLTFMKLTQVMNELKDHGFDSIMVNCKYLVVHDPVKATTQQPTKIKPKRKN